MLVSAVTGKGANGKKKKPPLGLDTHMLNNRTAAAAGVGKRGIDTKACPPRFTALTASVVVRQEALQHKGCLTCFKA